MRTYGDQTGAGQLVVELLAPRECRRVWIFENYDDFQNLPNVDVVNIDKA